MEGTLDLDPSLQDPEAARRKFRSRSVVKSNDGVVDTTALRERATERQLQLEAMGLAAEAEGARAAREASIRRGSDAANGLAAAAAADVDANGLAVGGAAQGRRARRVAGRGV